MKHRSQLVSNSSSSSFIVAFPRKPKDIKDVIMFMWNGQEGSVGDDYGGNTEVSYDQAAQLIFNDIQSGAARKVSLSRMIDEMSNRYYYSPNLSGGLKSFSMDNSYDERGGHWYYETGRYFCSDQETAEQLKNLTINEEIKRQEFYAKEEEIMKSQFEVKRPKWAYEGSIDPKTGLAYTRAEIDEYKRYEDALENFRETNADYVNLQREESEHRDRTWTEKRNLEEELAEADAKNFLEDNKDKFVFLVDYSDNDGEVSSKMEHGDIFRNVPHVRVSHH